MPLSFTLVSLGCPKNQVDSENMFTRLKASGSSFEPEGSYADVCIINTCGFIGAARKESLDVIMDAIVKKKAGKFKCLVVAGCMVNNNLDELKKGLPEVDIFLTTFNEERITDELKAFFPAGSASGQGVKGKSSYSNNFEREHFNLKRTAYLKIAEGCSRTCSFCTIPFIRGEHKSRPAGDIKKEAEYLVSTGVRELILVSQDTSFYGNDLRIENGLYLLLKELVKIKGLEWIRILYFYPSASFFTPELVSIIKNEEKILPYIDMPMQHFSDKMLKLMKRGVTGAEIRKIVDNIRKSIPGVSLRTSFIVGFPGESDHDFSVLMDFVKETGFDNMGVFKYSDERQAGSSKLSGKVPAKVKNERYRALMEAQKELVPYIVSRHIGKTYAAILDETVNQSAYMRTFFQAPDIDGRLMVLLQDLKQNFKNGETPEDFAMVKITKVKGYDLLGVPV